MYEKRRAVKAKERERERERGERMWSRNGVAFVVTAIGATAWTKLVHGLARRGVIEQKVSRKVVHIGTGLGYMLTWPLYTRVGVSRWLAASVPMAFSIRLGLVGVGVLDDKSVIAGMTRTGDRRELLTGPMIYGFVHSIATVIYWMDSPHGVLALVCLCAGDGAADIVGRRLGKYTGKWPHSPQKSYAGTAAFVVASTLVGSAYLHMFGSLYGREFLGAKLDDGQSSSGGIVAHTLLISTAASLVESLPFSDIDNITLTLTAALLSSWRCSTTT